MATYGWLSAQMRYTVLHEIGNGKMTVVHQAIDDDTGKVLAVKVYKRLPTISEDAKRRAFLREEAEILTIARDGVSRVITDLFPEMLPLLANIVLSLIFLIAGRCGIWTIHL
jgi:serine/threonine protein kinase